MTDPHVPDPRVPDPRVTEPRAPGPRSAEIRFDGVGHSYGERTVLADIELVLTERGAFITGSDILIDGGGAASHFYGPLAGQGADAHVDAGREAARAPASAAHDHRRVI